MRFGSKVRLAAPFLLSASGAGKVLRPRFLNGFPETPKFVADGDPLWKETY